VSGRPLAAKVLSRGVTPASPSSLTAALELALGETGALGATVKQLASRVRRDATDIASELGRLSQSGTVSRMGRGLWVWHDFTELTGGANFADPAMFVTRFQRENRISLGRYAGPITFRSNEVLPLHRWWPYVQGYSAEFVAGVLSEADLRPGATILDPFAGSGTTLVEARRAGYRAWGTEILAPAALAARVKTYFELDGRKLVEAGHRVVARARRRPIGTLPFLRETRRQFSPRALRELTRLRDALPPEGTPEADALRVAFGRILIPSSRLHRSPCLGYRRGPVEDGGDPPFVRFESALGEMRVDLEEVSSSRELWGPPATIDRHDARTAAWPTGSVDLAITSPPYVNGMDYVMNYKVDLAWLGYAHSYTDLAALRAAEVACDNLPRTETNAYLGVGQSLDPWLDELLPRIRDNVARKGSYRRDDVHAVVHRYFADLRPVLAGVYRALRPGGRFVIVVGDSLLAGAYVPGDLILARMGERLGYRLRSVEVARPRRSGQRRSFLLRESVVTLERPRSSGKAA
jgi:SAM-dependent methyltransferase